MITIMLYNTIPIYRCLILLQELNMLNAYGAVIIYHLAGHYSTFHGKTVYFHCLANAHQYNMVPRYVVIWRYLLLFHIIYFPYDKCETNRIERGEFW